MAVVIALVISLIIAAFGGGYYAGYLGEHQEVLALQTDLNTINRDSQKLLRDTQQHNATLAVQQQQTIKDLEGKYYETIGTNDDLHQQLVSAQLQYRQRDSTCRINPVSKAHHSSRNQAHAEREPAMDTREFSTRFDQFISTHAAKADALDADKRFLLNWIDSIPAEMVEK